MALAICPTGLVANIDLSLLMAGSLLQDMRTEASTFSTTIPEGFYIHYLVGYNVLLCHFFANTWPGLVKAVRAVKFSPAGKLLAAAGDSKVIALYDVASGEQVAILTGHGAWVLSLDWSYTGEYLLSG